MWNKIIDKIPNYLYIFKGLKITLGASALCFSCGIFLGILFGLGLYLTKTNQYRLLNNFLAFIQKFFINTPIVSQIFICYFVLSLSNDLVFLSIVVLGLNSSAHISVMVVEYLSNLSRLHWETAYSLGFNTSKAFYYIFLKEMFYSCRQSFFGEFVALIKESALLSFFGAKDICLRSKEVGMQLYTFAPYILFSSILYFTVIGLIEYLYNRFLKEKSSI